MKKLTAVLFAIPALALAHPGHEEGYHFYFHAEFVLMAGLAAGVWMAWRFGAVKRRAARERSSRDV